MPLSLAGNPNFVKKLPLNTFNIQFMYDKLIFFFIFTMKQMTSIFCNISFARQYSNIIVYQNYIRTSINVGRALRL